MNKREIVREMQKLVLTIYENPDNIDDKWMRDLVKLQESMAQLSPSELEWANNAYEKWHKNNPVIQKKEK